ncbi:SDR family oxidoreductase [Domibacillus epiphyticus]|uniref:Sugar epimerase n=1 Tax=Domibacillus epiphyticus TaxID=1714355 RepID=A0A1V2ABL0_9BACI|nr:SDR family oxidoreductase [Domibacillus epiphyticus]OMP68347.1 sugar epimerase [Domibacillus epiphyticus]
MKVLVVGANGQIGQKLIELLQNSSKHEVRAMVRKEEQAAAFKEKDVDAVIADLEGGVNQLKDALYGCDAVVFTAGSGGHTGADKTLLIDLDGAVKTVEAAEQVGVKRFIMVSALQANNRENWNNSIRPYYAAKHYADRAVEQSSLIYTIIRPGGLLNDAGTGKIEAGEKLERGTIPREDVAAVIYESLDTARAFHRSFDLITGEKSISEALNAI